MDPVQHLEHSDAAALYSLNCSEFWDSCLDRCDGFHQRWPLRTSCVLALARSSSLQVLLAAKPVQTGIECPAHVNEVILPSEAIRQWLFTFNFREANMYVSRAGHVAAPVAAAARWAPTAVTTILELWDRQSGAGGRAAVVAATADHLVDLPAAAQPPLARQLVPLIAKLPFATERAEAFAKVHPNKQGSAVRGRDLCLLSNTLALLVIPACNAPSDANAIMTSAAGCVVQWLRHCLSTNSHQHSD